MVETVEFHPESGRTNLIFEHFPPGFQHVEKFEPNYRLYSLLNVENFAFGKHCEECRGMLYFRMYQCQNIVKLKQNETMARLKRPALP